MPIRWAIITGEYPPRAGGVSDYTRQLAAALVERGDEVHVIAPAGTDADAGPPGSAIHVLPDHFGFSGLARASKIIDDIRPGRVLVQYVPHGFGMKAMNLPFAYWVSRRTGLLDVMFHEVLYPRIPGQPWRHVLIAKATAWMARRIARRADRIFVSSQRWIGIVESVAGRMVAPVWTPVPTNVPTSVPPERVAKIRTAYAADGSRLVGHFGTYSAHVTGVMEGAFTNLLERDASVRALLLGRGSDAYARDLVRKRPEFAGRIVGAGALPADEVAAHLSACDLLLQPYIDGVCTRRSTTMAGLALSVPVVTCRGESTEPLWNDGEAVALAGDSSPDALAALSLDLLSDDARRSRTGRAGRDLYHRMFQLSHTVDALRKL